MPQIYSKSLAEITDTGDDFDYGPNGGFTAILSTPSLDRDGDRLGSKDWIEPFQARYPLDIDHGMTVADTVGSFEPFFADNGDLMMRAYFSSLKNAQDTRTLIEEKHINAVSVAFMNDKAAQKDGAPHRELLNAGIVAIPSNRDAVILASKAATILADTIQDKTVDPEEIRKALGVPAKEEGEDDRTVGEVISDLFNFDGTKSADGSVYVNVVPKLDMKAFAEQLADGLKAAGGDAALIAAIHDASVHLGAMCVQLQQEEDTEDTSGKSITFRTADDECVRFGTSQEARELCTEMLKSLDDAAEAGEELVEVGMSKSFDEAFDEVVKTATDEVETPEESPADDAETAADAAVPVEKAAESEAVRKARRLTMMLDLLPQ